MKVVAGNGRFALLFACSSGVPARPQAELFLHHLHHLRTNLCYCEKHSAAQTGAPRRYKTTHFFGPSTSFLRTRFVSLQCTPAIRHSSKELPHPPTLTPAWVPMSGHMMDFEAS